MRALVIPDVHLKPWMFQDAETVLKRESPDQVVCLMDIADDWRCQYNLDLYTQTYDAAIAFAKAYPNTLWCYGNHDVCYLWNMRETGYSPIAPWLVCEKIRQLLETVPNAYQVAYIHRLGNVLFMHGGLYKLFVHRYVIADLRGDIDEVIRCINELGCEEMWQDLSPIWARPQVEREELFMSEEYIQVVGHTPVREISRKGSVISCDVFSTNRDRLPIGTQEFLLIDTDSGEFRGVGVV